MERLELNVIEVGNKARSKGKIYRPLETEGGVFLPPVKDVNYQYLRDIITRDKKVFIIFSFTLFHFKGSQIKYKFVPFFKDLTMDKIFKFAEPI